MPSVECDVERPDWGSDVCPRGSCLAGRWSCPRPIHELVRRNSNIPHAKGRQPSKPAGLALASPILWTSCRAVHAALRQSHRRQARQNRQACVISGCKRRVRPIGSSSSGKSVLNELESRPLAKSKKAVAKSEDRARTCLLVLGMHRSGTSAVARLVSMLGASLPKKCLAWAKATKPAIGSRSA